MEPMKYVVKKVKQYVSSQINRIEEERNSMPEYKELNNAKTERAVLANKRANITGIFRGREKKELDERISILDSKIFDAETYYKGIAAEFEKTLKELKDDRSLLDTWLADGRVSTQRALELVKKYIDKKGCLADLNIDSLRSDGYYYNTFSFGGKEYSEYWRFKYELTNNDGYKLWEFSRKTCEGRLNLSDKEIFDYIGKPSIDSIDGGLYFRDDYKVFVFGPYAIYVTNPFEGNYILAGDDSCEYVEVFHGVDDSDSFIRESHMKFVKIVLG